MKHSAAAMFCSILALCACSHEPQSEYDPMLKMAKPSTDEARRQECSLIQAHLARQKSLATYIATTSTYPAMALEHQAAAQRNMAALESRAEDIKCAGAFPSAPAASAGQPASSFDQCFPRCKQYTDRTNEQCFDACNK